MQQIKTFQGENDDEINKWLREHPNVNIIDITRIPMHDRYFVGGDICNQWVDIVIVYKEYNI